MMGAGAAKTGSFLMRLGMDDEEEEADANATGRIDALLFKETMEEEARKQVLTICAVDIATRD